MIKYKDKTGAEHDFDAFGELEQMGLKPTAFDPKTLVIEAEDPGGQIRKVDIGGYINAVNKSTGNNFKITQADALNQPEDALNQEPDHNFWRRVKLGFGDDKGKINYLKKTFSDAQVTKDGTLVVNEKGVWKRIDPKGMDPGDLADMVAYLPNVVLSSLGEVGGAFAGGLAGPGAPAAIPAGIIAGGTAGGAAGEAARQGVGKMIGVQSAMDPKEIALQGAISGAGSAVGVGAGMAAKALKKPAQKAVQEAAETVTQKVGPKVTATLTGIPEDLAQEGWKNPVKVFTKANLSDDAMLEAGKKAQRALQIMKAAGQREYKMATKEINKYGNRMISTKAAANALKAELIRDGVLDKTGTKVLKATTLDTDKAGRKILLAVWKKVKGGTMSIKEFDKMLRQINQLTPAWNEAPKIASPNMGKLMMVKKELTKSVGKVIPEFTERNQAYAEAMQLYNKARKHLGDEKLEGFFTRLFTAKNKEAVKEVFDELNAAVPKGAKFLPKVKQVQAAREFSKLLPAGNLKDLAERSIPSAAAYGASRFGIVPPWLSFALAAAQSPVVHRGAIKATYGLGSAALKTGEAVGKVLGGQVTGGLVRQSAVRAAMNRRRNKGGE